MDFLRIRLQAPETSPEEKCDLSNPTSGDCRLTSSPAEGRTTDWPVTIAPISKTTDLTFPYPKPNNTPLYSYSVARDPTTSRPSQAGTGMEFLEWNFWIGISGLEFLDWNSGFTHPGFLSIF